MVSYTDLQVRNQQDWSSFVIWWFVCSQIHLTLLEASSPPALASLASYSFSFPLSPSLFVDSCHYHIHSSILPRPDNKCSYALLSFPGLLLSYHPVLPFAPTPMMGQTTLEPGYPKQRQSSDDTRKDKVQPGADGRLEPAVPEEHEDGDPPRSGNTEVTKKSEKRHKKPASKRGLVRQHCSSFGAGNTKNVRASQQVLKSTMQMVPWLLMRFSEIMNSTKAISLSLCVSWLQYNITKPDGKWVMNSGTSFWNISPLGE